MLPPWPAASLRFETHRLSRGLSRQAHRWVCPTHGGPGDHRRCLIQLCSWTVLRSAPQGSKSYAHRETFGGKSGIALPAKAVGRCYVVARRADPGRACGGACWSDVAHTQHGYGSCSSTPTEPWPETGDNGRIAQGLALSGRHTGQSHVEKTRGLGGRYRRSTLEAGSAAVKLVLPRLAATGPMVAGEPPVPTRSPGPARRLPR